MSDLDQDRNRRLCSIIGHIWKLMNSRPHEIRGDEPMRSKVVLGETWKYRCKTCGYCQEIDR